MWLLDKLDYWARHSPDAPALIFGDETTSFAGLQNRVHALASWLVTEQGLGPGDRIAFLGLNHPDMVCLVFACARIGGVFVPLNTRLAREEYRYLIGNAEPKICLFDETFEKTVAELQPSPCSFVPLSHLEDLETVTAPSPVALAGDAPLLLVYTSGTTGRPKGVVLSQAAVVANIENGHALYAFGPGQKILITLPLFHVGGMCILLLPALAHGATVVLHARFDPQHALATLRDDGITSSIFVPAQMAAMMGLADWSDAVFPQLTHVVVGSSLIPMPQIRAWHDKSIPVSQVYGATETGPTAIGLALEDAVSKAGSAGRPAKLCSIEIRHPEGQICATGENGELWVKGPNILSCYWREPEQTRTVLQEGWYNTGDIGHVDTEGFYWIVDRSKDVIISGGENIYPAEVEAVAIQHPAIAAIAIVGRPDPYWGETPVAAVELQPGAGLTRDDLLAFLKDKIARFKQPREVVVFDTLPRNGMGKIEKPALRTIFAGDGPVSPK